MPVFALDETITFPYPEFAEPDGLLAIGGDLSVDRLLLAYTNGIFPWYNPEEENFLMIDCQFHTDHLESMGGEYIGWTEYKGMLNAGIEYE